MLTAYLLTTLLTQTPDSLLGEVGESCRARSDCRAGLKCINALCTAPAPQTKEGQACEATPDCSSDGSLRCIAKVCKARAATSANAAVSPPPPPPVTPTPYVPASATLSDSPGPVARSANLVGQAAPTLPSREYRADVSQRALALETEIESLNSQLRAVQTGWPGGSIALVVIGAVLSPLSLIGLVLLVIPIVGVPVLLIGLGGIAMIVAGAVGGSRASEAANAEREALIQRRQTAERELTTLRRVGFAPQRAEAAMMTVATF